jgi:hypothetical protein
MKKVPFGCSHKQSWTNVSIVSSVHHQGSVSAVERYNSRRCHLGADYHSATSFLISSLEDKALFQGGGHVRDLTSLTPHVDRIIYFHVIKADIS